MARMSELTDREVITSDAYNLGEVIGAEVDTKAWKITHLNISLTDDATRELGFKKPFLGHVDVCLPVDLVEAYGDVITLRKNLANLKELPECMKK
jgi:sporulation protein YlmC with PRC-barrel domain